MNARIDGEGVALNERRCLVGLRRSFARIPSLCAFSLLLAAAFACSSEKRSAARAAEVEPDVIKMLELYLPALATAYGTGNIEALRPWAVQRHLAQTQKRVHELVGEGLVLEPKLISIAIEDLVVWNYSNAYVTTLETWDLRYFSTGSHSLVSEQLAKSDRVKYQLHLKESGWMVLHRELEGSPRRE